MRRRRRSVARKHGFTLLEVLAALAITAVIIAATTALVHNVALYFDKGTQAVGEGERLILAVERLTADFGSARFVMRTTDGGPRLAFTGEPASGENPPRMLFVAAAVTGSITGEEAVSLSIEQNDDVTRLVRRRAPWLGPRTRFDDLALKDPVILLEGKLLMSFDFGRIAADGAVSWNDAWKDQVTMPRLVRLNLRDRSTGIDLLAGNEFLIRADASAGCAQAGGSGCVAGSASRARQGHDG